MVVVCGLEGADHHVGQHVVIGIVVVGRRVLVFDSHIGVILHGIVVVILLPRSRLQIDGGCGVTGSAR